MHPIPSIPSSSLANALYATDPQARTSFINTRHYLYPVLLVVSEFVLHCGRVDSLCERREESDKYISQHVQVTSPMLYAHLMKDGLGSLRVYPIFVISICCIYIEDSRGCTKVNDQGKVATGRD